jgi:hypothetical protein
MPGFRLEDRGVRTDILVHTGHPPTLYLSSIGCLNPTEQIAPGELMNFWDSRRRVVALLESLKAFAPQSFEDEVNTEIPGAFAVIDGEPMESADAVRMAAADSVAVEAAIAAARAVPASLPISEGAARKCATWLWQNFRAELSAAVPSSSRRVRPWRLAARRRCRTCPWTAFPLLLTVCLVNRFRFHSKSRVTFRAK